MSTLPSSPDDLTPSWLSDALGTEVTSVEVLDHAFATNQRARIGLTYGPTGAGPDSLFVKLTPIDPAHREMVGATGMGRREAQFYADVSPSVDLPVPRCWYAGADDDLFVLLLEDLGVRGCRFSTKGEFGVSADGAASALADLARFHGRFTDPAARQSVAPWLDGDESGDSTGTAGLMRWVLDQQGDNLTPAYREIGELYAEHHAWFNHAWHAGPQTYIHGDLHIGNVYLDGDRVGYLDWGLSRVSTPLRDMSYFLTMSVDIEARRANERTLIADYLQALRAAGGPDVSFDEAWAEHRVQSSYTVIATFLAYMPSYQAGDGMGLGRDLLARADAAIADLDPAPAIRALL